MAYINLISCLPLTCSGVKVLVDVVVMVESWNVRAGYPAGPGGFGEAHAVL